MSINMSIHMCSRTNKLPKQEICCCVFTSIFGLAWGTFFLLLSLKYKNSFGWREFCLVISCVLLVVSTVILIFTLIELIKYEMCCFQKDFLSCDIENNTNPEEQFELTDSIPSNILNRHELSVQQNQDTSPMISETYSNVFFPGSPMSSEASNLTKNEREDRVLEPEPCYTLPYECESSILHSESNNAYNTANKVLKLKIHETSFPGKTPVTSEESYHGQDLLYCENNKTNETSNDLYISTTDAHNSGLKKEAALYENVKILTHLDETRSIIIHNELYLSSSEEEDFDTKDIFGHNTVEEFNTCGIPLHSSSSIEANAGNTSSKGLAASSKSSATYIDMISGAEYTTLEELALPGKSSPTYANLRSRVENTSHEELTIPGKSSSTYVNVRPRVENTSHEELTIPGKSSPTYVNVRPRVKNTTCNDVSDESACLPRHINENPTIKKVSIVRCNSSTSIKSILV